MSKSLNHVLYYNENKVKDKDAICIEAVGFGQEHYEMNAKEKLLRLKKQARKRMGVKTNAVHISLSFEHGEKFSSTKLKAIAGSYMEKIGFGDQPYLVYLHKDTANPHIHIVSTNIRRDGSRIPTHNIGANIGMTARVQVEEEFGLVKAAGRKGEEYYQGIVPADFDKILAGTTKNKPTVANIVRAVISKYQFTSLGEFNAVLRQFHIMADPGAEGTKLQERGGLLYSVVDKEGTKVGAQIKASSIYINGWGDLPNCPTLRFLEGKFVKSSFNRREYREQLTRKIDEVLEKGILPAEFKAHLRKQGIEISVRYNVKGNISGIIFIDNENGVVFKGSDLRKGMGAAGIEARLVTGEKVAKGYNETFVKETIGATDFSKGFEQVLAQWKAANLAIEARHLPDGEVYFFMGAAHLTPSSFIPVSSKIRQYILANLQNVNAKIRPRYLSREDNNQKGMWQELDRLAQINLVTHSIIEDIVTAETSYGHVPYELLKVARKRRKRKRRSG